MDIVYLENDWIRLVVLQNFHYLLMEKSWRLENDWIHKKEDGTLENYKESIEKRSTANIRKRVKDDALAIKDFYYNEYQNKNHPTHICFPTAEEFHQALEKLKSQTFVTILSLHYVLKLLSEMNRNCQELKRMISREIDSKSTYVQNKKEKSDCMYTQLEVLQSMAIETAGVPLGQSIHTHPLAQLRGFVNIAFEEVVPVNIRAALKQNADTMTQVEIISDTLIDLLNFVQKYPTAEFNEVERKYRKRRNYEKRMSKHAVFTENRIKLETEVIRRNILPPFKKVRRTEKLKNSFIQKKVRVPKPIPPTISKRTKFFFEAFHSDDAVLQESTMRESVDIMDTIQESNVPFYFDHFLQLHDYKPNYNFKTIVELRDGPEEDRCRFKSLIPAAQEKVIRWEAIRKKIMDQNIRNHPEMYLNLQV